MTLINLKHREDFGHEYIVQVLNIKRWSLIQVSVSWNDFPGWPYIKISSGCGSLISIMAWAYKLGFDFSIIDRTWNWHEE